jgi:hypothetical protein
LSESTPVCHASPPPREKAAPHDLSVRAALFTTRSPPFAREVHGSPCPTEDERLWESPSRPHDCARKVSWRRP